MEVIQEASFEDIEMNTFLTILDQDYLHIDNELDLFFALTRYAVKHGKVFSRYFALIKLF